MVNCINLIIEISPRFILERENVPCVTDVVNRSFKADCTDFTIGVVSAKALATYTVNVRVRVIIRACHKNTRYSYMFL